MKKTVITALLAALLVIGIGSISCSVPDGGDMDAAVAALAKLPAATLTAMRLRAAKNILIRWLQTKPPNDEAVKMECKDPVTGEWHVRSWIIMDSGEDVDTAIMTVKGVIAALVHNDVKFYSDIPDLLKDMFSFPNFGNGRECRGVFDFRYVPEEMPDEGVNPEKITDQELVKWMVKLPVPPPELAAPALEEIGPLLCPLGAGQPWGCPSDPTQPPTGDHQ